MVKLKMTILIAVSCLVCILQVSARDGFPPKISVPQGNKWSKTLEYVRKASPNTYKCEATATPPAKYYWTINGTVITPDPRTVTFDKITGTLTTGSLFGPLHSGDYQCYATNKYGTAMTPIKKIIATVANPFKGSGVSTTDESADVSKYFKLECKDVPLSVPQWQFSWQKGVFNLEGELETTLVDPSDRLAIDKKGNLHFLWAEKSDNGYIYACSTKNNVLLIEVSNTQTIRLTVNDGDKGNRNPQLEYFEDVVVTAGENAELMCIFSYYSELGEKLKINWLRNGVKVGEGYKHIMNKVKLPDNTQNLEGEYMCEAKLGNSSAYGLVNLKIVGPPRFIRDPQTKSVPVGEDAVFHCEGASHNSHMEPVVWFMNTDPIIGCKDRRFECKAPSPFTSYSQCLEENMVCNNDPDCEDESDEKNCPASCAEGQVWCKDRCQNKDRECAVNSCEHPNFLCEDKRMCLLQPEGSEKKVCNGVQDCDDGSDERACPGGPVIVRKRWRISSDRKTLTLPNVTLDDTLCVQCLVRNEYGSTIGDACLTVINKIAVTRGPNATYDVEPGMSVYIQVEATTDRLFQNQMKFKWQWYEEQTDKKTGITQIIPVLLPPKSALGRYIRISQNGKNFEIEFPEVADDDENAYEAYYGMKDRLYTLIIEHTYDRVELNFTINGIDITKPTGAPVIVEASSNLWFIALILAILILFIVVALIVCYMYRNRGGTYLLDKKEHQAGHDPAQELKDSGLHDVGRIDDEYDDDKPHADEASLSESVKPYESDDDPTEEYGGDFDVSKFNEDGSFIGLYGDKKSKYSTKEATV